MIESMFGEGAFTPPVPGETPNDDNIVLNIDGLEIIINPKTRVSHLNVYYGVMYFYSMKKSPQSF